MKDVHVSCFAGCKGHNQAIHTELHQTHSSALHNMVHLLIRVRGHQYNKLQYSRARVFPSCFPRYYGLLLWFPEYFKRIQKEELNATGHYIDMSHNASSNCSNYSSSSQGIYIDSVYTSLAAIPATILGILTANILGGKVMLSKWIQLILLCSNICFCSQEIYGLCLWSVSMYTYGMHKPYISMGCFERKGNLCTIQVAVSFPL